MKYINQIAADLGGVDKHQRNEELRRRLGEMQTRFLPSRAIYLPVSRRRHRVYWIVLEVKVQGAPVM